MRLNVYIAKSGVCSRRKADELIKGGKVSINGTIASEPWHDVRASDKVSVDGRAVSPERYLYLAMNKPPGYVTTRKDRHAERCVTDLLPARYRTLYPVGRLDKNTRGLLFLTNDGDFCHYLTHPRFGVEKEYVCFVYGNVRAGDLKKIRKGVKSEGELLKVKKIAIERELKEGTRLRVVVSEGKKRHIRRIFSGIGFTVADLKRVRIGDVKLAGLKEGEFRQLHGDILKQRLIKSRRMVG